MKLSTILLTASVTLNGALAVLVWPRDSHIAERATLPSTGAEPSDSTTSSDAKHVATAATTPAGAQRAPLWIETPLDRLDDLIARLHAAGFPPREIKAVVMACIGREFNHRQRELWGGPDAATYWQVNRRQPDPKREGQMLALFRERQRLEKKYQLDPEFFAADEESLEEGRRYYGDLPADKLRALAAVEFDFQGRMIDHSAEQRKTEPGQPRYGKDSRDWWKAQNEEKLAAVRALLTPAEFAQYELHASPIAQNLRSRLETFRPSEAEYKALFAIEKTFSSQPDNLTAEQRRAVEQARDAQITIALGPERAADYAQLFKGDGDKLNRLMVRLDLPLATVGTINSVRDQTLSQAKAIRADAQLTDAARAQKLAALAQTATSQLTSTLGARGYEAYEDMKGSWLNELKKTPPAAPAASDPAASGQ